MLKTLDVLIGLATIMLLFSLPVTVISQALMSLTNMRGRSLFAGLRNLLMQLDPALDQKIAGTIAEAVLKHPLVADQWGRLGSVIQRGELTTLLLQLVSAQNSSQLESNAAAALRKVLADNGIKDPGAALSSIQALSLQLEQASPELAAHVRETMAILKGAESSYVAKINAWFDRTIDRVSDRFTAHARMFTLCASLVVAGLLQLDVVAIMNRLSLDDSLRKGLAENATTVLSDVGNVIHANGQTAPSATPSPSPAASPASAPAALTPGSSSAAPSPSPVPGTIAIEREYYNLLASEGLVRMPVDQQSWWESWACGWHWRMIPGFVLAVLLLSLGAPFWYGTLQSLLRLRSVLSNKDDQQRTERQTSQAQPSPSDARSVASVSSGERGDLNAVG